MSVSLAVPWQVLPATSPEVLEAINLLEEISLRDCAQVEIPTDHLLHAGMYVRTIELQPGTVLTGALMTRSTVLIVCGRARMLAGSEWVDLNGYTVIPASARRKQVFESISRTWITMVFPSAARNEEEAEAEFTDEADRLASRRAGQNTVRITGE